MEGRLLGESRWYYGSSDGRGSSKRCHTRSEAGRALERSAFYELRLEVFYTQHNDTMIKIIVYHTIR